jgi:hypothetical protein
MIVRHIITGLELGGGRYGRTVPSNPPPPTNFLTSTLDNQNLINKKRFKKRIF